MSRAIVPVVLASGVLILSWFGRPIQRILRETLGLNGLLLLVLLMSAIFAVVALKIFRFRGKLAPLALLFFPVEIFLLRANPEEGVHLVEYGTFALSLLWSLSARLPESKRVTYAILGGSALGLIDETLQGINPERIFDLRDILFNILGSTAAVIAFRVKEPQ